MAPTKPAVSDRKKEKHKDSSEKKGKDKDKKDVKEVTDMQEVNEKKTKERKKQKKEKKRSETDGVHKEKKDRKTDKKEKEKLAKAVDRQVEAEAEAEAVAVAEATSNALVLGTQSPTVEGKHDPLANAIVKELAYFALPMALGKKEEAIFCLIAKACGLRAVHRGLNEVQKALKRITPHNPALPRKEVVKGFVILAADINPSKVIEHFPILCEDLDVPYIFVVSRRALGMAAATSRSTCVVFLSRDSKPLPRPKAEEGNDDAGMAVVHGNRDSKRSPKQAVKADNNGKEHRKHPAKGHSSKPGGDDDEPADANKEVDPKELAEYQASLDKMVKYIRKAWAAEVYPYMKGTKGAQMAGCTIAAV